MEGLHLGQLLGRQPGAQLHHRLDRELGHVDQEVAPRVAVAGHVGHRQLVVVGPVDQLHVLAGEGLQQAVEGAAQRVLGGQHVPGRQVGLRLDGQRPLGLAVAQEPGGRDQLGGGHQGAVAGLERDPEEAEPGAERLHHLHRLLLGQVGHRLAQAGEAGQLLGLAPLPLRRPEPVVKVVVLVVGVGQAELAVGVGEEAGVGRRRHRHRGLEAGVQVELEELRLLVARLEHGAGGDQHAPVVLAQGVHHPAPGRLRLGLLLQGAGLHLAGAVPEDQLALAAGGPDRGQLAAPHRPGQRAVLVDQLHHHPVVAGPVELPRHGGADRVEGGDHLPGGEVDEDQGPPPLVQGDDRQVGPLGRDLGVRELVMGGEAGQPLGRRAGLVGAARGGGGEEEGGEQGAAEGGEAEGHGGLGGALLRSDAAGLARRSLAPRGCWRGSASGRTGRAGSAGRLTRHVPKVRRGQLRPSSGLEASVSPGGVLRAAEAISVRA